jgi:cell filamentation protein
MFTAAWFGRAFLRGLPAAGFAGQAAVIVGDINYIHPFREGNGRTRL